jgi:hypothetical protein
MAGWYKSRASVFLALCCSQVSSSLAYNACIDVMVYKLIQVVRFIYIKRTVILMHICFTGENSARGAWFDMTTSSTYFTGKEYTRGMFDLGNIVIEVQVLI